MLIFVELIRRMEAFLIDDCDAYEPTPINQLMVVGVWLPGFTYLIIAFNAYYIRTLFHVFLVKGILLTNVAMLAVRYWLPIMNASGLCANRVLMRPCEDAAVIGFVMIYYITWSMFAITQDSDTRAFGATAVFLMIYTVLGLWSQTYLNLFTHLEVVLGALAGVLSAFVVMWIFYEKLVPQMDHPFVKFYLELFGINTKSVRSTDKMNNS